MSNKESEPIEVSEPPEVWSRIAAELRAVRDDQRDVFGAFSYELLSRFLAGEATESESAQIKEATANDPELREALDTLTWALTETSELPADIPNAPSPLFIAPAQTEAEPDDDSYENWQRVRAELQACRSAQMEAWGEIDERVVARFVAHECSAEERRAVEAEMVRHPELRGAVDHVRGIVDERITKYSDDAAKRLPSATTSVRMETPRTPSTADASRPPKIQFMRSGLIRGIALAIAASVLLAINALQMARLSQARTELAEIKGLIGPPLGVPIQVSHFGGPARSDHRPSTSQKQTSEEELASTETTKDGTTVVKRWVAEEIIDEATGEKRIVRKQVYETSIANQFPSLAIRGQIPQVIRDGVSGVCHWPAVHGVAITLQESRTAGKLPLMANEQLVPVPEIAFFAPPKTIHWLQTKPRITQSPADVLELLQKRLDRLLRLQGEAPITQSPPVDNPSPEFPELLRVDSRPDDLFPTPPLDELIAKLERESSPLQTWAVTAALQITSCGTAFPFGKLTKRLLDWDEFGEAAASYVLTHNLLASIGNPGPATDRQIEEGLMGEDDSLRWAALYSLNLRRVTPIPYAPQGTTFYGAGDSRYVSVLQRSSSRKKDESTEQQSKHLVSMNLADGMPDEEPIRPSFPPTFSQPARSAPVTPTPSYSAPSYSAPYEEPLQRQPAEPTEFERRMLMRVNELLAAPDSSLARRAAVHLVGDYGHSAWGCEANLIKILAHSKSGDERRWAAFALGQMLAQTESTKEQLIKSLDDDDPKVRPAAAMALAEILKDSLKHKAVDQARRKLKNMLTSSDPATQRWAAYVLQVLSGKKMETHEYKVLKPEPDPQPPKEEAPKSNAPKPADDGAPKA